MLERTKRKGGVILVKILGISGSPRKGNTLELVGEDLKSLANIASWIINKDVPEDVVYRITKIIC
jgi:hypothetical protein